jgi:hypothetical protein
MDVNDIKAKLARLHSALDSRIDPDYERHTKIEELDKGVRVTIPGIDSLPKLENVVRSIIDNLATLKDAFKNKLKKRGENKPLVKNLIDSSIFLRVLIDLDNAYKHGYPTESNLSKMNPLIKNVRQTLRLEWNEGQFPFAMIGTKGETEIMNSASSSVVVLADIYNENGDFFIDLDNLIEICYNQWLSFAEYHKLLDE